MAATSTAPTSNGSRLSGPLDAASDLQDRAATSLRSVDAARVRMRQARRRCGQARRQVARDRQESAVDRAHAWRTAPRHASGAVAVSFDVWVNHVRYHRTRAPEVRQALIEEYRGYASALARRLYRDGEAYEDLAQVALEALMVSIDRFDPDRGIPFPAFATPTIVGSLKRHYRDLGWALRVPRKIHELAAPARMVAERLTAELGRAPSMDEVARELGVSTETLLEAQEALQARAVSSLDAPIGDDGSRLDVLGGADDRLVLAENRVGLHAALEELSDRERQVLGLYFFEELTQSEIAERFGVSQMQVSRWLTAAIRRLRDRLPAC